MFYDGASTPCELAQCTAHPSAAGALHCLASGPSGFECIHKNSTTCS